MIEDTNYRVEFGGQETAAIKFHLSVDTIIRNNLVRGVSCQKDGAFGIWTDAVNQNTRVSGNLIYNTELEPLFFEMNHGPILVDNNIVVGNKTRISNRIRSNSGSEVYAHNLFVDCGYHWTLNRERHASYYKPHTVIHAGKKHGTAIDNKWYNNIYVRIGLDEARQTDGYQADYNLFLEGAKKSSFEGEHSVISDHVTGFKIADRPLGATVTFSGGPQQITGPWVDAKLVGVFQINAQSIEDRYGNPIRVDRDINGRKRSRPLVGPLADLKPGENSISWDYSNYIE